MYDDFEPPNYFEDSINYVKNQKRPRHIKTHLPWVLLPNEIQNGTKKPKVGNSFLVKNFSYTKLYNF